MNRLKTMKNNRGLAAAVGLLLTVLPACLSPEGNSPVVSSDISYKIVTINERVSADFCPEVDDPLMVNPADRKIHLYAAGGETVAFQMVIPPAAGSLSLRIDPMSLVGTDQSTEKVDHSIIERARWRVYQLLSIPAAEPDAFDVRSDSIQTRADRRVVDPMMELPWNASGAIEIPRSDGKCTLLWLEVEIPTGTPRADYLGRVLLTDFKKTFARELTLHTWGFDLPDSGVDLVGLVNVPAIWRTHQLGALRDAESLILPPESERTRLLAQEVGRYCRLLDENGIEPWLSRVYPKIDGAAPDQIAVEWSGYHRLVQAVVQNTSRERKYWPLPVDLSYPPTQVLGPYNSPLYRQALTKVLREFNEKYVKPGLLGKPIAVAFWPETFEQAVTAYPDAVALMKECRRSEEPLTILSPFVPSDLRPFGWTGFTPFEEAAKLADGFCPRERWLDPACISKWQEEGKLVWWRPTASAGSIPASRIGYPGYLARAMAWSAWKYGATGIVLGEVNDWPVTSETEVGDKKMSDRSSDVLIYPGSWFGQEEPLGSVRLKLMRSGLQDIAYLRALEKAGKADSANWLAKHLVRFAHADACDGSLWTIRNDGLCDSDLAWMLPRLIAGFELSAVDVKAATTQRAESDKADLLRKLFISQFRQFSEGLALESEGVRAKYVLDLATGNKKIEWTFNMAARNFTDLPGDGRLAFANLPDSLQASRDQVELTGLDWAWPIRTTLSLETPAAAIGMFGVNYQPVTLKLSDNSDYSVNCRYCALVAGRPSGGIRIDGDLGDWPENAAALAGDFQRIWPDGINGQRLGNVSRAARLPTTVRIATDERNLYLAFTCYQPLQSLIARSSNTVETSAALPWGEDLVAVVLDPENTSSLNPIDAYQVIVKANGNVLTFRGSVEAHALRASDAWPNHVRAAVKNFEDRWQVELAIPLADLNASDKLDRWWGVDFARFAAEADEFSTWSGTKNQYAKPISMGNVFLPR
jgi:hypothetical protein